MAEIATRIDITKVRQLRPFKIDYTQVKNLELRDINNKLPANFLEYRKIFPLAIIQTEEIPRPEFPSDLRYLKDYTAARFAKGKMLVLVQWDLYDSVKDSIRQYVMDLAYEGWYATVYKVKDGKPNELRNFIKLKMPVEGVVMVGSVVAAWYEMSDDFDGSSSQFPCDLYYMDTNGTWSDPDGDGMFSSFTGNLTPEIWVGRIWSPTTNGNDATLINDYFARNHKFRKGQFGYSNKALSYVDDDWTGFGDCSFDLMFPPSQIETITDPTTTDGDRYKAEINQHRAWAQVCSHSSPGSHSFKVPSASTEWVPASYLRDVNPPNAYFYNLFACSNARFTQAEYMGGWYIFDKAGNSTCNGLAAVGSTKTGSMLLFENFYGPMASGKTIGEALLDWWKALGTTHDLGERRWYYGMTLLGDPTLNWWTGIVPALRDPFDGDNFDHFPRRMNFTWDPIGLPGVTYNIEIDAHGARVAGQWAAESGQTWLVSGNLTANSYEHLFVGAQRGRWRVRARAGGMICPWSDWRYFRFTT